MAINFILSIWNILVNCDTFIPWDRYIRYILLFMGNRNKWQRQIEALAQACRSTLLKNEDLDIVDDEPKSGNDVLEIDMESFISVI